MADPNPDHKNYVYSYAIAAKKVVNIPFPLAANVAYDSFWRDVYNKAAEGIGEQARALLARGNVTAEEARQLVEVQRNGLVIELRKPLSPFGKLYSEILKPAKDLPTLEQLVAKKGSIELVLESVGKTRGTVNKINFFAKRAGGVAIALEIVLTVVVIAEAPADQRGMVASREIGGVVVGTGAGVVGGWAGAWAGATTFALAGSPTLVIPVVGEITETTFFIAGGIIGFLGGGWIGQKVGEHVGMEVWKLKQAYWR